MRLVNVGMAIEVSLATQLAMNLKYNEDGTRMANDITDEEARQLSLYASGHWKDVTSPNNQKTYRIISFYVPRTPVSEEDPKLALVESVIEKIKVKKSKTDDLTVIGAWNRDGSQYGTTIVPATYDEEGIELTPETIEGVPVYPINPMVLACMPDDVTYDADGNELTRTPATQPKEVCKLAGWKDRRWS